MDGGRGISGRPARRLHASTVAYMTLGVLAAATPGSPGEARAPVEWGFAAWSPDGASIAYASSESGRFQLYVRTGDVTRRLTFSQGNDISPDWSPDGESLVFVSDRDDNMELYTVRADGSGEERRTHTEGSEMAPDWGPDDHLAFAYSPSTDPGRLGSTSRIVTSGIDGSNRSELFESGVQHYPRWSPDGVRLTFSGSVTDDAGYQVWITDIDGDPISVSGGRAAFNSDWLPDGSAVVFVSPDSGVARIFRADASGAAPVRITNNDTPWFEPRVSPDGQNITVRVGTGTENVGIGILDAAGTLVRMLDAPQPPAYP